VAGETYDDPDAAPRPADVPASDGLVIGGLLGEGGMGSVHAAEERALGRIVAVKSSKDPRFGGVLTREALVLAALEHPNILPIYALLPGPRLVLRKIGGVGWDALIHDPAAAARYARGDDPLGFHVRVLLAVCDAVAHAHARRILHRDLKPANVMLGEHGEITLLDWGLAVSLDPDERRPIPRAADARGVAGTPTCMAPEQATGGALTERTDVFALGALLHEVLTRSARHPGTTVAEQLAAARAPTPVSYPPSVDEVLAELANQATSADPDDRPPTAEAFRARLVVWQRVRVSVDLTTRAKEQIKLLRQARKQDGPTPLVLQLVAEASATLHQALDIWPENTRAQQALDRLLKESFEAQLALGNLDLAEDSLQELETSDPELTSKLAAARLAVRSQAERVAALEQVAADQDGSAGIGRRRAAGAVGTLFVGGLCAGMVVLERAVGPLGYPAVLAGVASFAVVMLLTAGALRFRAKDPNRRLSGLLVAMVVGVGSHWVASAALSVPVPSALGWSCLVAGGLLVGAGVSGEDRASLAGGAVYAGGFVAVLGVPTIAWELFALTNALSFATWTAVQLVARSASARDRRPS
jgi:serine/threonine protein kinase